MACLATRDLPSLLQSSAPSSLSKLLNDPTTGLISSCSVSQDPCTSPSSPVSTSMGVVKPAGSEENKLSLTVLLLDMNTEKHIPVFWDRDVQTQISVHTAYVLIRPADKGMQSHLRNCSRIFREQVMLRC